MNKVKETYGVSDELWNRWKQWLENDELWPSTCDHDTWGLTSRTYNGR